MSTFARRTASCTGVFVAAIVLLVTLPVWFTAALLIDVVRGRWRLPIARLLTFGLCWAWLESVAIVICAFLWAIRQAGNRRLHYRLQAWWAAQLMGALRVSTGIRVLHKVPALAPGPVVMLCRHASLADSLVSAWIVTSVGGLRPRYVLKRELLADPCLDIVGHRLPNHFLDRTAVDGTGELASIAGLGAGLDASDIAVIFPEGTRSSPAKRARALQAISAHDPQRAARFDGLQHLLPPRPAGSWALVDGAPNADVVLAWHSGFDGLDTFSGILRHLATPPPPVRFACRRIARADVPARVDQFTNWLDDQWLRIDNDVNALINFDAR
jgi:1-acyl-sn-glycerol-3-phosphate acyltransferase